MKIITPEDFLLITIFSEQEKDFVEMSIKKVLMNLKQALKENEDDESIEKTLAHEFFIINHFRKLKSGKENDEDLILSNHYQ